MKKLLSIVGTLVVITSCSNIAVACGCVPPKNRQDDSTFNSVQISNTTLKNIMISSNEVIYSTSQNHVYQINSKKGTFIELGAKPLPDFDITGLLMNKKDELYIVGGKIDQQQVFGNIYKYNKITNLFESILKEGPITNGYIRSAAFDTDENIMYISINKSIKKWEFWQINLSKLDESKEIEGVNQIFQMDNIINKNNTIYTNDTQNLYYKVPDNDEFEQIALDIPVDSKDSIKLLNIDQTTHNIYLVAEIGTINFLYKSTDGTTFNPTSIKVPWSVNTIKIINDIVYLAGNNTKIYQGKVADSFDDFITVNNTDMAKISNLDFKANLIGLGSLTGIF